MLVSSRTVVRRRARHRTRPGRSRNTAARILVAIIVSVALQACALPAHESEALRVMSFNIRYGTAPDGENRWELRSESVVQAVRDFDPAVLGLQEALRFQLGRLKDAMPVYR